MTNTHRCQQLFFCFFGFYKLSGFRYRSDFKQMNK